MAKLLLFTLALVAGPLSTSLSAVEPSAPESRHGLAMEHAETLRFSTLFLSSAINSDLTNEADIARAIDWCREHGILKVYLETYRSERWAKRAVIAQARDAFRAAGFEVSGCVTTTKLKHPAMERVEGELKPNVHLACYSDPTNQDRLQEIFEYTASLFDEIIIDDFYSTVCECDMCTAAKGNRTWSQFRADLMLEMSRDRVIGPAKRTNPDCRITIKFPVWYDHLMRAGYDVARSTPIYDAIFTGNETRDPQNIASNPQYAAYYMMRLMNAAGGAKNLGGWFDFYDTAPEVYLEQARQTILGSTPEVMLFHYLALAKNEAAAANMAALVAEMPGLFQLAELIKGKMPRGVTTPKPLDSSDLTLSETKIVTDRYLMGFLGMLGIPVEPVVHFDGPYDALIGTQHLLYDDSMLNAFAANVEAGAPALITAGLANAWKDAPEDAEILTFSSKMDLVTMPREQLNKIRNLLLEPLGIRFDSPARVSIHLYGNDVIVIENFNDEMVTVGIEALGSNAPKPVLTIPQGRPVDAESDANTTTLQMAPRTLVALWVELNMNAPKR